MNKCNYCNEEFEDTEPVNIIDYGEWSLDCFDKHDSQMFHENCFKKQIKLWSEDE